MNPSESKQKRGAAAMCRGCTVGRHLLRRNGNAYQREPTKGRSVRIASAVSTPGCEKTAVSQLWALWTWTRRRPSAPAKQSAERLTPAHQVAAVAGHRATIAAGNAEGHVFFERKL